MINVLCLQIACVNVISLGAEKAIFLYEFWLKLIGKFQIVSFLNSIFSFATPSFILLT